jgi:hypothetical protein
LLYIKNVYSPFATARTLISPRIIPFRFPSPASPPLISPISKDVAENETMAKEVLANMTVDTLAAVEVLQDCKDETLLSRVSSG